VSDGGGILSGLHLITTKGMEFVNRFKSPMVARLWSAEDVGREVGQGEFVLGE